MGGRDVGRERVDGRRQCRRREPQGASPTTSRALGPARSRVQTQVDLPSGTRSGLRVVQEILDGVDDVNFSMLNSHDVVRHRLVSDIVDAYGRWDATQEGRDDVRRGAGGPSKRGRR